MEPTVTAGRCDILFKGLPHLILEPSASPVMVEHFISSYLSLHLSSSFLHTFTGIPVTSVNLSA